ncbi:MAG: monovalent cation/H(+) antiporter subunit G [bacterium]
MIAQAFKVFFLTFGTFFMFIAALGIFRMPDVYNQLHTSTKAITVSLVNLLLGAMIDIGSISVAMKSSLIIVFQFLTAPVAAHMIARVKHPDAWDGTIIDEMKGEPTAGRGSEEPEESVAVETEEDSENETPAEN